ncbi:DNA-binding response regulator, NarL/FixJ family, contains REC and HTH domains [Brevibacterium iodinum ATCC 49514]|uniref:DNA-binding response regulator, NarL/FixJ family, contains REC and HTH domains n=1 Tax=Brevibacterium iodinum ATCC 49514 TaxID=1255616 RepID=A0A2H1IN77_9MICO|nr:response regulator transcription factor [Brevibacterium iodinum]SMX76432.1 DNA-binding response regulator, NarL/FixJ family, contains REC and HTH domains [Brevibacterium iodinum ATCC 49514]SUW11890.1 Response regulator protein vraR [Brevibacterium iodinum]
MIRIVIADDQAMVRAGFAALLSAHADIEVIGQAEDGAHCVDLVADLDPDIVLMDVRMPLMDGIEATRTIVAANAETRIIMLTTFDIDDYVFDAIRAGASGFLLKDAPPSELAEAVRIVAGGEALLAPSVTKRVIEHFATGGQKPNRTALPELTDREREILIQVARGASNTEIAASLDIAVQTVKTHVSRILYKLDARDRAQAVIAAYESGLIVPNS